MRTISQLRFPLDPIFSASSHIPILRVLQDCREGMSGRAIARAAHINHQSCAVAVRNLESLSILRRRGSGRTQLIHLNFENYLVKNSILPLLEQERELFKTAYREIKTIFKDALVITLFGSAARGQEKVGSDIDVLVIVLKSQKEEIANNFSDYGADFKLKFGIRLSPIILTQDEVKSRIRKSDPLIKNILAEGVSLTTRKLQEII